MAIDIGLSKSATGFSIIDTQTEDIDCEKVNTIDFGLHYWGKFILDKLNYVHEYFGIDYVAVEENFGKYRGVVTRLNMAVGMIWGWCIANEVRFLSVNPTVLNQYIRMFVRYKGTPKRDERKQILKRFFDIKMENNKNLSYNQDLIDSFCVCHYMRDTYYPRV